MTAPDEDRSAADLQVVIQYRLIEALQEREHQLAEAQRLARLGSWDWDAARNDLVWSDELFRVLGLNPGAVEPKAAIFFDMVREDHRARAVSTARRAFEERQGCEFECPVVLPSAGERWTRVVIHLEAGVDGAPLRMHGIVQDVTDTRAAERRLAEANGLFEAVVENTSDILSIVAEDGTVRYSSPSTNERLGYVRGERRGIGLLELVHPDDIETTQRAFASLRAAPEEPVSAEVRLAHADGSWRIFQSTGRNLLSNPSIRGFLFTSQDVTEARELERRLAKEILHDPLTGLPSRELLTALALASMARASRRSWTTALMIVDIDQFRLVNDEHGFDAGDTVLIEIAARLEKVFRSEDGVARAGSVGRFAGDEFLILCEHIEEAESLDRLRERITSVFQDAVRFGDVDIYVTASSGISLAGPGANDFDVLLREAESAVRAAKSRGGNAGEVFDKNLRRAEAARSDAQRGLQRALDQDELRLFFQPKLSLTTNLIVGVEGLLRWEDPERGLVPPLDFIPIAEETGLIVPIGAWVIEEACRQGVRWASMFPERPPVLVCVNVSARQFGPHLLATVASALAATGLPATQLGLEVTESILMDDVTSAIRILEGLKELGVTLSVDDFGTGYSSLAYLKQFKLHELKIDKSFVDGLGQNQDDSAIVAAVIALAHALGLGVVAEGVETVDQLDRLRSLGCDVGQGYFFARPTPAGAVDELLREEARASWGGAAVDEGLQDHYRPVRALVVDDSPEIRQLTRVSLAALGFEVTEASDGRTGIEAALRMPPDCILLDVVMPEVGGIEACRALRADPVTAHCTIVMLTANADAADKVEAFSAGADDYIIKPFSPRDLAARVNAAMKRRAEPHTAGPDVP
ncbi:MAG TPA: EAL domain-containing protein [Acidimicrobiales bacterium]|nr:EAL domain-containing protein [Acidimicrobiales bacterium]